MYWSAQKPYRTSLAYSDMDIAHFETTIAFLQILAYFKNFIPLGFNEMASTGLSVE